MGNRDMDSYDPGAGGGGLWEADIALQWALSGRWVLNNQGIATFLTRDDDRDVTPVALRDDQAAAARCSHFISIHCNAASPNAHGTETFYRDANDRPWALNVQQAALKSMGLRDRGIKLESQSQHARLAVLNFAPPACLLELGFITNKHDRAMMVTRECRIAFWEAIAEALS